jgi:UrcA family protein
LPIGADRQQHPRKPAIHEPFSQLSPAVDLTIMQAAGHLHNLAIMFRPLPTKEIAVNSAIKTQSKLAKIVVAAGFLGVSCIALSANARANQPAVVEVPREYVTYPVRYSDLDLSKLKGAKILYLRIRHAADVLCESAATWGKKEGEACLRKATDDAVARVDVPLLTQYYELRSKGDKAGLVQLAKAN